MAVKKNGLGKGLDSLIKPSGPSAGVSKENDSENK